MNYKENVAIWLNSNKVSEEEKAQIRAMDDAALQDAFGRDAEFGTGGMRAKMGPGTNRLNRFTLGKANYGFALFLLKNCKNVRERGVVISHDNRYFADEFTKLCADIFNRLGIKAYVFDALRPTPELSYAVRYLGAAGGVMITASHNAKEYNGYKVYDETGCQIVPDKIAPMLELLASLPDPISLEMDEVEKKGETLVCPKEVDDTYVELVKKCQINPDLDKKGFKVIYTPQHGASYETAMRVFQEVGYEIIPIVEQCNHDPAFGGTKSPNPEVASAWEKALEYAHRYNADLAVMTDPDGDRCGLAYLSSKGTYERLTGNESGALLIDYLFSQRIAKKSMPENPVMYDTIVTSSLGEDVAASYGVKVESFLTGFKFIGERIAHYEREGHGPTFVFGYEESYGCLIAPFVRDKDGIQAILLYTEMALFYKRKGIALDEALEALEAKHGYHYPTLFDTYFEGAEGPAKMKSIMANLRKDPPKEIAGLEVKEVRDYLLDIITDKDGKVSKIEGLPPSDVLKFVFVDGSTLAIRPSGTEPKIKFYVETMGKSKEGLKEKALALNEDFRKKVGIA